MRFFETDGWGRSVRSQAGSTQPAVARLGQHRRHGRVPSGDLWAQRLCSPLLVTFPQSGIWEMKHLLLGVKAGLIYFGEKGEGEE